MLSTDVSKRRLTAPIPLIDTAESTFRIFLQWAHAQLHSSDHPVDVPDLSILPRTNRTTEDAASAKDAVANQLSLEKAFDKPAYQSRQMSDDEKERLYLEDEYWVDHFKLSIISFINLYIFADKYSIHQLRDDIMTAMASQANTWGWWVDPTPEILSKVYIDLPPSAKIHQFMINSTASYWPTEGDLAVRLRRLHEWEPRFAFEVSLMQVKMLQALRHGDIEEMEDYPNEAFKNSCSSLEHSVCNKDACRARIKEKAHIFAILIEASAKDAIWRVKEQEKKAHASGP